jgi:hypothetical protein
MDLPDAQPSATALTQGERRHHPRYTVKVQIEIRREGSDVPMRLETTDLSRGGCYIQLIMPMSRGTRVQVTLWLDGCPIVIHGLVVTRHPDFGNGIIFVDFQGQAEQLLQRYLQAVTT